MTTDDKSKDELIKDFEKLNEQAVEIQADARRSLTRLLIGGNAGGAIATLSLIGTILGSGGGPPFPRELFWALTIFLIGFLSMGGAVAVRFGAASDSRAAIYSDQSLLRAGKPPSKAFQSPWLYARRLVIPDVLRWASMICLMIGTGLALIQLYRFSA